MAKKINALLGISSDVDVTGPYFVGQKHEQCGHYYPDVCLVAHTLTPQRKVRSILFCFKDDKYLFNEVERDKVDKFLFERLGRETTIIYGDLEELEKERITRLQGIFHRSDG